HDPYVLVTLLISLDVFDTFTLHAKDFAGLSSRRNFHFYLTVQSRDVDFCTQGSLNETYGNIANNIQIVAHENRVRFDLDDDVKIPRRAPSPCGRTFSFVS